MPILEMSIFLYRIIYLLLKGDELVQWLPNLSNIVLCIVGIVSAVIVHSTYKHNYKLAEAKFANAYEKNYYTQKMYTYIRTLADFRDKRQKGGKTSLEQFIRRKTNYSSRTSKDNRDMRIEFMPDYQKPISPEVNDARRAVQNYFSSALELYEVKIISRETFIRIIDKSAFCLYFDVIEPLMFLENKSYRHEKFYKLMQEGGYLYEERQNEMENMYWRERVWQECRPKRRRRRSKK